MKTSLADVEIKSLPIDENSAGIQASKWRTIYKTGAIAALVIIMFIPTQIFIFFAFPPPTTVDNFFQLFQDSPILGLLEYDFLMIIDMILLIFVYLSLYFSLRRVNPAVVTMAFTLGLVAITTFFASNTSLEMLSLSRQFAVAATDQKQTIILAAGKAVFEIYNGTAFAVYYVLSAVALLLFTWVMSRSNIFSKANVVMGVLAGMLMLIPPTPAIGKIGLVFSVLSLVPWTVWLILFARRLLKLAA